MDEPMVKIANETASHLSTESMSLALDELLDAREIYRAPDWLALDA